MNEKQRYAFYEGRMVMSNASGPQQHTQPRTPTCVQPTGASPGKQHTNAPPSCPTLRQEQNIVRVHFNLNFTRCAICHSNKNCTH